MGHARNREFRIAWANSSARKAGQDRLEVPAAQPASRTKGGQKRADNGCPGSTWIA
jgi:hypothetical protein